MASTLGSRGACVWGSWVVLEGITLWVFKESVILLGLFELLFFKDLGNLQGVWLLKE
jgi:hypothetical protein